MLNMFYSAVSLLLLVLAQTGATGTCGIKPQSSRIVGGSLSKPNAWPWMVQIINTRFSANHHWCGGALISPEWLVTATHCVNYGKYSDFVFILAEHDRFSNEGHEQVFTAKKVIERLDYNKPSAISNDIALVQLDRPAILSSRVGTVCLPAQGYQIPVGSRCITAGWGLTSGGGKQSRYLKEALMPIADTKVCQSQFGSIPITKQMVCGGSGGNSVENNCISDSGGPLMCPTADGRWVLQGIVSFGDSRCSAGKYTVYARVSKFRNWIKQHTGV